MAIYCTQLAKWVNKKFYHHRKDSIFVGVMKFKSSLIILILLIAARAHSQKQASLECLQREYHVIVHLVHDERFFQPITVSDVAEAIDSLNKAWSPMCVKFNLCEIHLDSNYNFVDWHQDTMEKEYLALHYEPRIINIIAVRRIIVPSGVAGYATLGGISKRTGKPFIIVGDKNPKVWVHEMGHFFGLKHTFEPTIGTADNANCSTLDDGICDTPPDPDPNGNSQSNCIYTGNYKDANSQYYNPLIENYMSYYGPCRKSFTHMQYEKMIQTYKIDPEAHF